MGSYIAEGDYLIDPERAALAAAEHAVVASVEAAVKRLREYTSGTDLHLDLPSDLWVPTVAACDALIALREKGSEAGG